MSLDCFLSGGSTSGLTCALNDIFAALGGQGLAGLIISGFVVIPFYFAGEGDIGTPAVILMLLGGVIFGALPPHYQTVALTLVVLGVVGAFLRVLEAYVIRGV